MSRQEPDNSQHTQPNGGGVFHAPPEVIRVAMLFDGTTERYGLLHAAKALLSAVDRKLIHVTGVFLTEGTAAAVLAPLCAETIMLDCGGLPTTRADAAQSRGASGAFKIVQHVRSASKLLADRLRDSKIEIIHSHYRHTFLIGGLAARRLGIRSAWHLHGGYDFGGVEALVWESLCGRWFDRVICISQWVQRTLPAAWQSRSTVLYNAVDSADVAATAETPDLRALCDCPANAPLIASFGSIIDRKGFDTFVEAAALIGANWPEARFVIVGDAVAGIASSETLRKSLQHRVQELRLSDRFTFAGYIADAGRLMPQCDFVVSATRPLPGDPTADFGEGFGLTIAEAMLAGVPVVAAECGAAGELIRDGRTGTMFAPGDAGALAAAVNTLLAYPDKRREVADAAKQDAQERFAPEQVASALTATYRELRAGR